MPILSVPLVQPTGLDKVMRSLVTLLEKDAHIAVSSSPQIMNNKLHRVLMHNMKLTDRHSMHLKVLMILL